MHSKKHPFTFFFNTDQVIDMQCHHKLITIAMIGLDNRLGRQVDAFGAARGFHHGDKLTSICARFLVLDDFDMVQVAVSQPLEYLALFVQCAKLGFFQLCQRSLGLQHPHSLDRGFAVFVQDFNAFGKRLFWVIAVIFQVLGDDFLNDRIDDLIDLGKAAVQVFTVNIADAFNKASTCHFVQFSAQFQLRRMGNNDALEPLF